MSDKKEQLLRLTKEAGAHGAACISAEQVVLDPQFRDICRSNGCGRYGRCYMCPPDLGELETLMAQIRKFSHAVIYQSVASLEDPFDYEGMVEAGQAHSRLSSRIQEAAKQILKQEFLHLSSGCHLCERCAKIDNLPCRHPQQALGAMEGYGIDVYRTVKDSGLSYTNGENTVTYFGMILYVG